MNFIEKYGKDTEIRALSWKQPFASLMLHGKVETRTWNSKYLGLVLICASKAAYPWQEVLDISGEEQSKRIIKTLEGTTKGMLTKAYIESNYPCGQAIAVGRLVSSIKMDGFSFVRDVNVPRHEYSEIMEHKTFVKYNPDLFCHSYTEVQPIVPFDWSGVQGWKTLDEETKSKIILL